MKKYKLITVSQTFTLKGLEEKANERLNEYAEKGWEIVEMRKGWSGFLNFVYIIRKSRRC